MSSVSAVVAAVLIATKMVPQPAVLKSGAAHLALCAGSRMPEEFTVDQAQNLYERSS